MQRLEYRAQNSRPTLPLSGPFQGEGLSAASSCLDLAASEVEPETEFFRKG